MFNKPAFDLEIAKTDHHWSFKGIPRTICAGAKPTYWLGGDNYENFQKNKPSGWAIDSITYDYNTYGYRSIEFDDTDDFVVASFGCSMTIGIGVPQNQTWPELFCNQLQEQNNISVKNFNLGWMGASMDFICRTMFSSIPVIKPDLVLMVLPHSIRMEIYESDGRNIKVVPSIKRFEKYYEPEYMNTYSFRNNFIKNFMFMKTFLTLHDIPWLFSTWDKDMKDLVCLESTHVGYFDHISDSGARDMMHPSVKSYTKLANQFLEEYNKIYENKEETS